MKTVDHDAIASVHPYGGMYCPDDDKDKTWSSECPFGLYDSDSEDLDEFFRSNPYHLGIYSAGNSGNTYKNTCNNTQRPVVIHDYPLHFNTIVHKGQTSKNT